MSEKKKKYKIQHKKTEHSNSSLLAEKNSDKERGIHNASLGSRVNKKVKNVKGPSSVDYSAATSSVTNKSTYGERKIKKTNNIIVTKKKNKIPLVQSMPSNDTSNKITVPTMDEKSPALLTQVVKNASTKNSQKNLTARPTTSIIHKGEDVQDAEISAANKELNFKCRETSVVKESGDKSEDSYEDDFEEESDENKYYSEVDTGDLVNHSTDSDSSDAIDVTSHEDNAQEISGLIMHPTIFKRQPPPPMSNDRKVMTKFLRMSNRSSTFVKTLSASSKTVALPPQTTFINFVAAAKGQEMIQLQKKLIRRGKELLDLITLDEISYDLFEIPPMHYDAYIKRFGKSTTKQIFIQTEFGEDDETQTDDLDVYDKWTQNPPYGSFDFGGNYIGTTYEKENLQYFLKIETSKLNIFLQNVIPAVITLLKQNLPSISHSLYNEAPTEMNFCYGYYSIKPIPICKGSPVTYICSSPNPSTHFLAIHGNIKNLPVSTPFSKKGVITIWSIYDHQKPECALLANSQPTCACFGPYGYDTVIAGMVDGSLMLWDLKESFHINDPSDIIMRSPTYNTAGSFNESHRSCVVSIQSYEYTQNHLLKNMKIESARSYHLFSLEEMGMLNIWVVVEVPWTDPSGLDSDLGLAPGGKVKLTWSSSVCLENTNIMGQPEVVGVRTFDFRIFPKDGNHILITTDTEIIYHLTRNDKLPAPKFFSRKSGATFEVRCINFSPHNEEQFVVGCSDGSAMLFTTTKTRPLLTISEIANGEPVNCMKWCPNSPAVFFVLDTASVIHIWNVMETVQKAIFCYAFSHMRVLWFTIYESEKKQAMKQINCVNNMSSELIIGKEDGEIEIYDLKNISCTSEDYQRQIDYMNSL